MPHSTHGTVVLMGSGEMAPSMVEVHKYAMSLVAGPVQAAFINTPAGFQLNADQIAEKAATCSYSSDELVRHYFTLVYADTGSYKAAAEKLQVDWRTVRKRVDRGLLQTYRNSQPVKPAVKGL